MSLLLGCFCSACSITDCEALAAATFSSWLEQKTTSAQHPSACTASLSGCFCIALCTAANPPSSRTSCTFGSQWNTTLRSTWQPSSCTDALSKLRAMASAMSLMAPLAPAASLQIGLLNVAWASLAKPSAVTSGEALSMRSSASFTGSGTTRVGPSAPSMRVVVCSTMPLGL